MKSNKKKVAVIGAGLAGLTAAYRLMQRELVEVDVFEAKNRVGGRVFTVLMENYLGDMTAVELGGQNITDGGGAVHFLNLAKEFNLTIQEKTIDINLLIYSEETKEYYKKLVANHPKKVTDLKILAEKASNIGELIELFCDGNELLQQALLTRMMAYEGLNAYEQSIYHNIETLECALSGGVAKVHEYYDHKPDQVVTRFIEGGNAQLPIEISKYLEEKLHYNKDLNKITINDQSAVLTFRDQSICDYDYVILAVPAAAFNNIDFSDAKIEKEKLRKITSIRCGANYKIALPLALQQKSSISAVIKDNMLSFYNSDHTIQVLYVNDKISDIQNFVNVLSDSYNYSLGLCSNLIAEADDQQYKAYKENVRHHWKNDRYFQGSYTGYSISISAELDQIEHCFGTPYKSLFTPINNVLFFAGEHTTILDCIGTMEAAVESGERIAKAVNQLISAP